MDADELMPVMKALGCLPNRAELDQLINEIDEDGSGEIDFDEFLTLMDKKLSEPSTDEELKQAFKVFDVNGDNISADELKQVLEQYGQHLSDEEYEEMIQEVDMTGKGEINYEEFKMLMTQNEY